MLTLKISKLTATFTTTIITIIKITIKPSSDLLCCKCFSVSLRQINNVYMFSKKVRVKKINSHPDLRHRRSRHRRHHSRHRRVHRDHHVNARRARRARRRGRNQHGAPCLQFQEK